MQMSGKLTNQELTTLQGQSATTVLTGVQPGGYDPMPR
jgi:hypothetical protein